jgi:large subunit ribosomal protein L29
METEKIRNLSDGEIQQQEQKAAEQIFRLRFQTKLGQNEGVRKLRELKTDIARMKTIARERELGLHGESPKTEPAAPVKAAKKSKKEAR